MGDPCSEIEQLQRQLAELQKAELGGESFPRPPKDFSIQDEIKPSPSTRRLRTFFPWLMLGGMVACVILLLATKTRSDEPKLAQDPAHVLEGNVNNTATILLSELAQHATPEDCWIALHGDVYDLTAYATRHPGGVSLVTSLAGTDGTLEYGRFHPESLLLTVQEFKIGSLLKKSKNPVDEENSEDLPSGFIARSRYSSASSDSSDEYVTPPLKPTPPAQNDVALTTLPPFNSETSVLSAHPSEKPSLVPNTFVPIGDKLTPAPSMKAPSPSPTLKATAASVEATLETIIAKTAEPTLNPTVEPTGKPTTQPTPVPTVRDTPKPTTASPTSAPTSACAATPDCVTLEELSLHNQQKDLWVAFYGVVYDLSAYTHPGGASSINKVAGKDGTTAFEKEGHPKFYLSVVEHVRVGILETDWMASSKTLIMADEGGNQQYNIRVRNRGGSESADSNSSMDEQENQNYGGANTSNTVVENVGGNPGQPNGGTTPCPSGQNCITKNELATHRTAGDLWVAFYGEVYDLSSYSHPGGQKHIDSVAGKDGTKAFQNIQHPMGYLRMVESSLVGLLV